MQVFLYIRVSSEEQARHGHSLEAQETALTEWVKQNKHTITGVYRDEGISGRKPYTKRPEMVRLLSDIEILRPDLVIFTKLDRWFRNIKEYYKVQEILDAYKVQWKAIHEDYDTTTSSGRLHVNIMLSVAQDEADRTSERIKAVQRDLVAKGRPISGSVPVGFKIEKVNGVKRIIKNEEEADQVRDLIEYFRLYQNMRKTIRYINEKYNVSRPKIFIKKLLTNPLLYGSYNGNDDFTEGYISKAEFDALQEVLSRNIKQRRTERVYLFSGMIVCPVCGNKLGGCYDRHNIHRYRCRRYIERTCTHKKYASEKVLEKYLLDNVLSAFELHKINIMKKYNAQKKESPAKYEARLSRLNEMFFMGTITQEHYTSKAAELKAKITELTAVKPDFEKQERILYDTIKDAYNSLDMQARQSFWRQLIKQIVIDDRSQPVGIIFL